MFSFVCRILIPVDQEKLFHKVDITCRCEFIECQLRKFHERRQRADKSGFCPVDMTVSQDEWAPDSSQNAGVGRMMLPI
jgi:hypothetical protein